MIIKKEFWMATALSQIRFQPVLLRCCKFKQTSGQKWQYN